MSSSSDSEPPSPSTSKRMESERHGTEALLAQVPRSLSQSDISESSNSGDEVKSDKTVAKTKPRSK